LSGAGRDGGLFALVGYLYQMLGGATDFVRCISPVERIGPDEIRTLISFETEAGGQDFVAEGVTQSARRLRVLTQYKFSLNPLRNPIRPAELSDIAEALNKSEAECNRHVRLPTRRILRSNRGLSSRASSQLGIHKIAYEEYDPVEARKALHSYASRFGMFEPDELHRGVGKVITELFELGASPGSHRFTREQLEIALVGFRRPRSIAIIDAADEFLKRLRDEKLYRLGVDASLLIDRQFVRDAMDQWIDDAFIVFIGSGGYGKTTALWQVLERGVDQTSVPRRLAALVASDTRSFGGLIEQWRGAPEALNVLDEVALERIKHANSDTEPPILVLGLDGIDEKYMSTALREPTARLIDFFWKLHQKHKNTGAAPPARLLITCRRRGDVQKFIETATGLGVAGKPPTYLPFEEFTLQEIQGLLAQDPTISPEAKRTLTAAAAGQQALQYGGTSLMHPPAVYDLPAARWLAILRHPILWRCFTLLTATNQVGLVGGDEGAGDCLAESFFEWFRSRAQRRLNLDVETLGVALRSVADACDVASGVYRLDLWLRTVYAAASYSDADSRRLYQDGLNAGLIEDIPPAGGTWATSQGSWKWRHEFLWSHLRSNRIGKGV
jgi:hypothetical protein